METTFGWTTDPRILEIVRELWGTGDELLSNRKDGGIHRVWVWPLGHFDDDSDPFNNDEPIFTRVDVAYVRYLKDGCTFLIWSDESVRAGTVEDAEWLLKGVNEETRRTQDRARWQARREEARQPAQPVCKQPEFTAPPYTLVDHK